MSKTKRPDKAQANMAMGVGGAPSASPSPAFPQKKPPPILPPTSSSLGNGAGGVNGMSRTAVRPRRDAPPHLLGRGQRKTSAGLKSASLAPEALAVQYSQPQPYSKISRQSAVVPLLTMCSSKRQLYLEEVPRLLGLAHCPPPPDPFPI